MPMPWGEEWGGGWADGDADFTRFLFLSPTQPIVPESQRTIVLPAQREIALRNVHDWTVTEI